MAPRLGSKVLLHTLVWSLLGALTICTRDDISCLKSIKDSLDDPHDNFKSSWNFNNNTEGFLCGFEGVDCWHPDENKVLNIRLSNMGLKGLFPLGIEKCTSLTGLNLSGNELSGPIPSNISSVFSYGNMLDLSSNRFSGNIPKQIINCSFLVTLKLDNNKLTGLIPQELALLPRMSLFSVANNQLYGPVPDLNIDLNESSYAGNPGLCGFPLEPCNIHSKANFTKFFRRGFTIGYMVSVVSVISIFMSYCAPWLDRDGRNKLLRQFVLTLISNRRTNKIEDSHQTSKMVHLDLLHEASREVLAFSLLFIFILVTVLQIM